MRSAKNSFVSLLTALFLFPAVALAQGDGFDDGFGDDLGRATPPFTAISEPVDVSREIKWLRTSHAQILQSYKEEAERAPEANLPVAAPLPPGVEKIAQKLAVQCNFDFADITVNDLRDWLENELDVNVRIDKEALREVNFEPGIDRFSFKLRGLSCRAALEKLLHNQKLAFRLDENVIVITSEQCIDESLYTHVYPVWDLVRSPLSDNEEDADYDTLLDCITRFIEPDSWDAVGGPATVSTHKGTLSISTTRECHDAIAELLTALRSEPVLDSADQKRKLDVTAVSEGPHASAVRKALEQVVDLEFTEQRLNDVLEKLQTLYRIPMLLDKLALADEVKDGREIVSVSLKDVSLSHGLKQMLAGLDLTYITDDEVVLVTTRVRAEETLQSRVYACGSFIDNMDLSSDVPARKELQRLAEVLMNNIETHSWMMVGGPGAIRVFPKRGLLIVSNTEEVHRQVHEHLTVLLRTRAAGNAAPMKKHAASDIVVKVYPMLDSVPDNDARHDVIRFFENMLENTDNAVNSGNEDFSITLVGKNLVVSHRRDAQRLIHTVLQKLSVIEVSAVAGETGHACGGMMGGGMGGGMF